MDSLARVLKQYLLDTTSLGTAIIPRYANALLRLLKAVLQLSKGSFSPSRVLLLQHGGESVLTLDRTFVQEHLQRHPDFGW